VNASFDSLTRRVRNRAAEQREKKDMPAALDWLSARHEDLPMSVVGHGMGEVA